jgi:hypothetical protein
MIAGYLRSGQRIVYIIRMNAEQKNEAMVRVVRSRVEGDITAHREALSTNPPSSPKPLLSPEQYAAELSFTPEQIRRVIYAILEKKDRIYYDKNVERSAPTRPRKGANVPDASKVSFKERLTQAFTIEDVTQARAIQAVLERLEQNDPKAITELATLRRQMADSLIREIGKRNAFTIVYRYGELFPAEQSEMQFVARALRGISTALKDYLDDRGFERKVPLHRVIAIRVGEAVFCRLQTVNFHTQSVENQNLSDSCTRIIASLAHLPPSSRTIFVRWFLLGQSEADIVKDENLANVLHTDAGLEFTSRPEAAVCVLLSRIVATVQNIGKTRLVFEREARSTQLRGLQDGGGPRIEDEGGTPCSA